MAIVVLLLPLSSSAQVLSVFEIHDPEARRLQQKYNQQLQQIGAQIHGHEFPYHFYLSRVLDMEEPQQLRTEQSSIGFDIYNKQMVLEITGNYYAAYSRELMDKSKRVRQTFNDVILPILQAAVRQFPNDDSFVAFAVEISHHVRGKVSGITTENAENIVFIMPRAAAHRLVVAMTPEQQQAAALDGAVYVDGEPIALWLTGDESPNIIAHDGFVKPENRRDHVEVASIGTPATVPGTPVSPNLIKPNDFPIRLITPDTLKNLEMTHQGTIERMVRGLDAQAHFVSYAPPAFVAFHQGAYLQMSLTTPLQDNNNGSRYQLAALAFDSHIAHLIRPVLAYFQNETSFDGVSFSTTLKPAGGVGSEAVEFFFSFKAMNCFANYDCTGQELLDSGIVLINGERAGVNLQVAERQ
ncbi:MAG TPA: hypothetical protein VN622_18095 [Clostridia bacterium]|nr:hypothetical protein [Clostridia bacterium]